MVDEKECKNSKNSTGKDNFYLRILNLLKETSDLTKIQNVLCLSKQNLNYYLRELKKRGLISNPSTGLWEIVKDGKNITKYEGFLSKDTIRGHGYVVEFELPKNIKNWDKRIEILSKNNIHFTLVGALKDVPRIKAMGRKIWLCKNKIRVFDIPKESYYGLNGIESRKLAFPVFKKIISIVSNKLNIEINPISLKWQKEHLAFIKNDLAIEENRKGNIIRVSDEDGEWLLIDDSLGKGGELEVIGKKALVTSIPMQKWWNEQKETKFEWTPKAIAQNFIEVKSVFETMQKNMEMITQKVTELDKENQVLKNKLNIQNPLDNKLSEFKDKDLDKFGGNYIG